MNLAKSQCNSRKKVPCPLNNQCMTEDIIYRDRIISDDGDKY